MKAAISIVFLAGIATMFGLADTVASQVPDPEAATVPDQSLLPYGVDRNLVRLPEGGSIHIVCMGEGAPTVILTAGLGDWSSVWNKVQPEVAKTTRVCAWDRAGFGFSGPSPKRQTIENTTSELEETLVSGKIRGPYVMVGHSLGAYETLLFTDHHAAQVTGIVFVDPAFPDQDAINSRKAPKFAEFGRKNDSEAAVVARRCASGLKSGRIRLGIPDPDQCLDFPSEFPATLRERSEKLYSDPAMWETSASYYEGFALDTRLAIKDNRFYGNIPIVVLTAGDGFSPPPGNDIIRPELPAIDAEWRSQHDKLAALSTRGINRLVHGSQHEIQQIKPDAVIEAIDEVVKQSGTGASQNVSLAH